MSHLQNCSLKIYTLGVGGGGGVSQDGCERRIKVFMTIFFFFWGGGVGSGGGGRGVGGSW